MASVASARSSSSPEEGWDEPGTGGPLQQAQQPPSSWSSFIPLSPLSLLLGAGSSATMKGTTGGYLGRLVLLWLELLSGFVVAALLLTSDDVQQALAVSAFWLLFCLVLTSQVNSAVWCESVRGQEASRTVDFFVHCARDCGCAWGVVCVLRAGM